MRFGAQVLAACVWLAAGAALADPVTLQSVRGSFSVSGTLGSYDGAYYRLLTEQGPLVLRAEAVTCTGAACPAPGETTGFAIAAAHGVAQVLVPALVQAFAAQQGFAVDRSDTGDETLFVLSRGGDAPRRFPIRMFAMTASEAFADLAAQSSDMAVTDRSVSGAEVTILRDAGIGDMRQAQHERLIALDGLVLAVSPRRGVGAISMDRLAEVLATPAPKWSDMTGKAPASGEGPDELTLTLRARGEDLPRLKQLLGEVAAPIDYRLAAADVAQAVRADSARLGVLTASTAGRSEVPALTGSCGLNHRPEAGELAMGRYPWVLPIKAYLPDLRGPRDMGEFVDFLSSDSARRVIQRAGFARPGAQVLQGDMADRALVGLQLAAPDDLPRLQMLVSILAGAQQVGLSIPAGPMTGAMRGLRRLAIAEFARGVVDGSLPVDRIALLASAPSAAQAEAYVEALRDDLAAALGGEEGAVLDRATVLTDGALLPAACPGAPWADWMNARVDVWLLAAPTGSPERGN